MIIQCEKCRTRFKLDDSRVTEAGVRVRCSRCSHTFVVKRAAPEEESDFDVLLQGLGGTERSEGDTESDARAGEDSAEQCTSEGSTPAESEENLGTSDEERHHAPADAVGSKDEVENPVESFAVFFEKGVALPQFQGDSTASESEDAAATSMDSRLNEAFRPYDAATVGEAGETASMEGVIKAEEEKEESSPDDSEKNEGVLIVQRHEGKWPVADSGGDETVADELPPLSITSRRKRSPLFPILLGALFLIVAAGAGIYLFRNHAGDVGSLIPGLLKKDTVSATIRSLEGSFLVNREAGELLVIRGEIFNSSDKPLSAMRVQGTVYGVNGSVLARRTVYCGNTFSPEELSFRSYSGMEKTMDRQFGDALANLEIPPGKGIPFAIVFKNLPRGAKDFGARIVDLSGARPAGR
jgi:predicted Zn finger-like uncharacterized protein